MEVHRLRPAVPTVDRNWRTTDIARLGRVRPTNQADREAGRAVRPFVAGGPGAGTGTGQVVVMTP